MRLPWHGIKKEGKTPDDNGFSLNLSCNWSHKNFLQTWIPARSQRTEGTFRRVATRPRILQGAASNIFVVNEMSGKHWMTSLQLEMNFHQSSQLFQPTNHVAVLDGFGMTDKQIQVALTVYKITVAVTTVRKYLWGKRCLGVVGLNVNECEQTDCTGRFCSAGHYSCHWTTHYSLRRCLASRSTCRTQIWRHWWIPCTRRAFTTTRRTTWSSRWLCTCTRTPTPCYPSGSTSRPSSGRGRQKRTTERQTLVHAMQPINFLKDFWKFSFLEGRWGLCHRVWKTQDGRTVRLFTRTLPKASSSPSNLTKICSHPSRCPWHFPYTLVSEFFVVIVSYSVQGNVWQMKKWHFEWCICFGIVRIQIEPNESAEVYIFLSQKCSYTGEQTAAEIELNEIFIFGPIKK